MFAQAYTIATQFTRPVIASLRYFDKTVETSVAAYVVLNSEGWAITAAHVLLPLLAHQQHSQEITQYQQQLDAIQRDNKLSLSEKRKRTSRLPKNPKWLTQYAFSFDAPGVQMYDIRALSDADIAIGRLAPFNPASISIYPTIKNPASLPHGRSLCKLGYPFFSLESIFDKSQNMFIYKEQNISVPFFPIEGIYTREIIAGQTPDKQVNIKFIETSSPGLRGQSGGPIVDTQGNVWGLQSRTMHLPLGFSPKLSVNGREIEEHQFLNVGVGVHPETIVSFLRTNNIQFNMTEN